MLMGSTGPMLLTYTAVSITVGLTGNSSRKKHSTEIHFGSKSPKLAVLGRVSQLVGRGPKVGHRSAWIGVMTFFAVS